MKKLLIIIATLALFALLFAGCGKNSAGTIRASLSSDPETLDPRKITETEGHMIANQIYEGLVTFNDKDEVVPACAEKWEISADGLTYTFHLRPGMKWSNGDPLTANDFEYGIKSGLAPAFASPYADILYYIKNAEEYNTGAIKNADTVGVKALDDSTLQIVLKAPCAYFVSVTAYPTYSPVNKNSDFSKVDKIICNGPFKVISWTRNGKIETVKNDNYYDAAKVKTSALTFAISSDNNTLFQMFKSGQIQFMEAAPIIEVRNLIKDGTVKPVPQLSTYYLDLNNNKAPFTDPRVRKALNLAINRKLLVEKVTRAGELPATAWIPSGAADATPGSDFRKVGGDLFKDNDVATAKRLLAEAGYPDGKGFPAVTYSYNTNDKHKAIAEAIQEMWKNNLGITIKLQNEEWKVFLNSRRTGDYMIARDGWSADYPDAYAFMSLLLKSSPQNNVKYANSEFDTMIDTSSNETDMTKRYALLHAAEQHLIDDMPVVPLYYYSQIPVVAKNLKGVVQNALNNYYFKTAYTE